MTKDKFSDDSLRALTIDKSLELSGICRPKLYEEIKAGHLPVRKIGRRTFILACDLHEYLTTRERLPFEAKEEAEPKPSKGAPKVAVVRKASKPTAKAKVVAVRNAKAEAVA